MFYVANRSRKSSKNHQNSRRLQKKIQSLTLYVVRVAPTGELRFSAPCIECLQTIQQIGINTIVYSNQFGEIIKTRVKNYSTTAMTYGTRYIQAKMSSLVKNT